MKIGDAWSIGTAIEEMIEGNLITIGKTRGGEFLLKVTSLTGAGTFPYIGANLSALFRRAAVAYADANDSASLLVDATLVEESMVDEEEGNES